MQEGIIFTQLLERPYPGFAERKWCKEFRHLHCEIIFTVIIHFSHCVKHCEITNQKENLSSIFQDKGKVMQNI